MKNLLCSIPLLLGLAVSTAHAQTLTLDQLTYINTLEEMSQDAYLTDLGWKFEHVESQGDSISQAYWHYYKAHELAAEVMVVRKTGAQDVLLYSSYSRVPFDNIREKIITYHMEFLGSDNSHDALRNYYRGNRYDVRLSLTTDEGKSLYHVRLHQHRLWKAYVANESGELVQQWVKIPAMSAEQKARFRAISDSLVQANRKSQPKRPRN